jgi:co-chaperonin GroES (HSP10)
MAQEPNLFDDGAPMNPSLSGDRLNEWMKTVQNEAKDLTKKEASAEEYGPFTAIMDRIQVRVVEETEEDAQGVHVPKKYRQHSNAGIIVATGIGVQVGPRFFTMEELGLVKGQKVMFGEYNAEKFDEEGVEYVLVRAADIRGFWPRVVKAVEVNPDANA